MVPRQTNLVKWTAQKVMPPIYFHGIYEGRTESHEQLFLHANWEQQTKESAVVDGTNCCVIL